MSYINVCDVTRPHVCNVTLMNESCHSLRITCCLWHDSFTRVTWLIHTCDMTHSQGGHDSFTRVTWRIHTCDMTHSHVWHDSFTRVTWLIHTSDMTHSHMWHDTFTPLVWHIHVCNTTYPQHIHVCNTTYPQQQPNKNLQRRSFSSSVLDLTTSAGAPWPTLDPSSNTGALCRMPNKPTTTPAPALSRLCAETARDVSAASCSVLQCAAVCAAVCVVVCDAACAALSTGCTQAAPTSAHASLICVPSFTCVTSCSAITPPSLSPPPPTKVWGGSSTAHWRALSFSFFLSAPHTRCASEHNASIPCCFCSSSLLISENSDSSCVAHRYDSTCKLRVCCAVRGWGRCRPCPDAKRRA